MREREHPMTQTMNATAARQKWSQVINAVARRQTRVIVEKSGIPVAAIISAEDLARFTRMEEQRRGDLAVLDASQATFAGIPDAELARAVDGAIEQVRTEKRAGTKRPATSA